MSRARVLLVVGGLLAVFGAGFGTSRALNANATGERETTVTLPAAAAPSAAPTIRGMSVSRSIPALKRLPTIDNSTAADTASPGANTSESSTGTTGGTAGGGGAATGAGGSSVRSSG